MVNETQVCLSYTSDGLTREWPIPFHFTDPADLLIVRSDGIKAVLGTGYSIDGTPEICGGYPNGGVLIWPIGQNPPNGTSFLIVRKTAKIQRNLSWAIRPFAIEAGTRPANRAQLRRWPVVPGKGRAIPRDRLALVSKRVDKDSDV